MPEHAAKNKGTGITESERYLKRLCDRSFLSLWSFPGVHNDKSTGQEVGDLLVVFENHVIIFSDKDCKYIDSGDVMKDWRRWYRRAIRDSAKQIFGAERWLRNNPDRLFLDQSCKIRFPIEIPRSDEIIVHRVVVTQSISEACRTHFEGGSGSLIFDSECLGDEMPFTVGTIGREKGFVHVLDDTSLNIVLETLDTAPDFIGYLMKKEKFLTSDLSVFAPGEEEFLGHFLEYTDENNEHDFLIGHKTSGANRVILEEGFWAAFENHPKRKIQIEANRISYFWDTLIEKLTGHVLDGTIHENTAANLDENEKIFRLLAKENRTKRRFLSDVFLQFIEKVPQGYRSTRLILPHKPGEPYYVFLALPHPRETDYEHYRVVRLNLLTSYCGIAKLEHPDARDVIGIATESGFPDGRSEDLVYIDGRNWTDSDTKAAEEDRTELMREGLLGKRRQFNTNVSEYPETSQRLREAIPKLKGSDRNLPCFCGSGRKTKKCHGAIPF